MSKRASTVLVAILVAFGFAVAFAYGGFDTLSGTGVLGVGQVQPPGLGEPPDALVATGKHITRYEWTCIERGAADPIVNHWWGTITQTVRAESIVKWNRLEMVLNYTFGGWVDDGEPIVDTNQTYGGAPFPELRAPACFADFYLVEPWFENVTVEDVEFSY